MKWKGTWSTCSWQLTGSIPSPNKARCYHQICSSKISVFGNIQISKWPLRFQFEYQDQHLDSHLSRNGPPSYESTIMQIFESFENPMAGSGNRSNGSHDNGKMVALLEVFIKKYVQCYGCSRDRGSNFKDVNDIPAMCCMWIHFWCRYEGEAENFYFEKSIRNRVWGEWR